MSERNPNRYTVVDVFTQHPLEGNALAVFPDGSAFDEGLMQRIARELNLSETVFVLPPTRPDCAARLRIFTPVRELPFAGHPTIGTSFVLLEEGIAGKNGDRFVLEEAIGPVTVRVEQGSAPLIWLTTPPIQNKRTFERASCAEVLGLRGDDLLPIPPQLRTAGNPTVLVAVANEQAVDQAWMGAGGLTKLAPEFEKEAGCLFVFTPTAEGAYSRMFAPEYGIPEDPATGSSTGPLAAYMVEHKLVSGAAGTRFISEQGTKMGRKSILHVQLNGEDGRDGIEVGGHVTPIADAVLRTFPSAF